MDHTREIITFQLGTYANYVGAHFWNQQEANFVYTGQNESKLEAIEDQLPNNDILYREGLNDHHQTTYTPRLLSVDLAGTLGHLPLAGELYGNYVQRNADEDVQKTRQQVKESQLCSGDQLDVVEQPLASMSEYQKDLLKGSVAMDKDYRLTETANSWVDYLYARYHPRTLNIVQDVQRDSSIQALGLHSAGTEVWQSPAFNEDFCDRIRLYVEECDGLQGFHMLFDLDDGFSGLASKCLEHLNDEYNRASFVMPLYYPRITSYPQADTRTSHSIRVVNTVLGYYHLSEQATMFTPLSTLESIWRNNTLQSRHLPGLHFQSSNLYQTSAVLAAYMDTITLSYRLRHTPELLNRFCSRVFYSGRKMTSAGMALPVGMQRDQDLIEYLDQKATSDDNSSLLTPLTPNCDAGTSYVMQSVMARGIPLSRLKRPQEKAGPQLQMSAYSCNSISQMLQLYYQCSFHGSITNAASTPLPLKTQLPFPYDMFDESVAPDGYLQAPTNKEDVRVESAPLLAAIQSSSKLGDHLDALHSQTHRIQLSKLQAYSQSGLERDEYETALDHLLEFRDNYVDSQFL
ncbi:uncharacterized protein Dwil_GK25434 [Drosophila willistoni]|uniref:Protein misato n=1 Tax=Drosophila willistoni TaxID=7260 RepID=B4NDP0_DROWI|nr:protein misato [Drosophila willistoni]EDW81862.1 uncharacterized protein Dwil_GK25434 [Drosophila willistoni]